MAQQQIDVTTLNILESGTLKTTGASYDILLLGPQHLAAVKELHDSIIDGLEQSEKVFMLRKNASYFSAHLSGDHGNAILGIVSNGTLIAQAVIAHPTDQKPDNGMVDMAPPGSPSSLSVLQAVSVLPVCRGSGLMNRMVVHWVNHAQAQGREHVIAEIETHNKASWRAFLYGGLNLESIGCDPADGTLVYNAHEKTNNALAQQLSRTFNRHSNPPAIDCPVNDIAQQKKLMAAGYAGVGYNDKNQTLTLAVPPFLPSVAI